MTPYAATFWVGGVPQPQGSKVARLIGGKARVVDVNHAPLRVWRGHVADRAQDHWGTRELLDDAVRIHLQFAFVRPASTRRPYPSVRPDLDKLIRAVLDALTGRVYTDDATVVSLAASKVYRPQGAGVLIAVGAMSTTQQLPTPLEGHDG